MGLSRVKCDFDEKTANDGDQGIVNVGKISNYKIRYKKMRV